MAANRGGRGRPAVPLAPVTQIRLVMEPGWQSRHEPFPAVPFHPFPMRAGRSPVAVARP